MKESTVDFKHVIDLRKSCAILVRVSNVSNFLVLLNCHYFICLRCFLNIGRTPIHGILGLTALLLESELTSDQRESLLSVKECADLLLHIINSVLDLSKIEAGRLEVETVSFSVRKMVSSTLRMMQARACAHNLQLLWDIEGAVPDTVVGDPGKLQQCLLNLGMQYITPKLHFYLGLEWWTWFVI